MIEFRDVNDLKDFLDFLSKYTQFDIDYLKKYFYVKRYSKKEKYVLDNSIFFDKYLKNKVTILHGKDEIKKILSKCRLDISDNDLEYIFSKVNLLDHQKEFLKKIQYIFGSFPTQFKHMTYLLSDDVGSGKTIQSLSLSLLLKHISEKNNYSFITILFTNLSIKQQIFNEINKFNLGKELVPIVINNKKDLYYLLTEYDSLMIKPNIVITHYELLRAVKNEVNSNLLEDMSIFLSKFDITLFLLDESTKLKNRDTDVYKQMFKLISSTKQSYTLLITATPIENNLLDITNLFYLGFGGLVMNPKWVDEHFVVYTNIKNQKSKSRFNTIKVVKYYKNLKFFKNFLETLMLRRTKDELNIELPNLTEYYVKISEIDKYQLELIRLLNIDINTRLEYNEITKSLISYIYVRQIVNSPKMLKFRTHNDNILNQLNNFKEYIDNLNLDKYYSPKEIALNNLLIDIFRSTENKRIVIFTFYEKMMEILYDTLSKMYNNVYKISGQTPVNERNRIIQLTHKKHSCILIATDSLSYGVNLQHFDYLINFDQPYNPSRLYQRIGRIHRIGGKNEKIVYNLFTPFEERVINILNKKKELIQYMINNNKDTHKQIFTEITEIYYSLIKKIISKVS